MPVHVQFGWGIFQEFVPNQPCVVLVDSNVLAADKVDEFKSKWSSHLVEWVTNFHGACDLDNLHELSQKLWPHFDHAKNIQFIAIGGGATLDLAKILRWFPNVKTAKEEIEHIWKSQGHGLNSNLNRSGLICWPTTAGTGSEVSASATLWDRSSRTKLSWQPNHGHADWSFIDPELTLTCPHKVTRDAGLDALSHALESLWNRRSSFVTRTLAMQAVNLIIEHLPNVLSNPLERHARIALSKASVLAGLAMSETQTALAHSLSYDLTINEGISHGEAVAIWLPMVSEMAFKANGWLEAELAKEVGCNGSFAVFLRQWLENLAIQPRSISDLSLGVITLNEALQSVRGQNQI